MNGKVKAFTVVYHERGHFPISHFHSSLYTGDVPVYLQRTALSPMVPFICNIGQDKSDICGVTKAGGRSVGRGSQGRACISVLQRG